MGDGERYWVQFIRFLGQLSDEERRTYEESNPEPAEWEGFYAKQTEFRLLSAKDDPFVVDLRLDRVHITRPDGSEVVRSGTDAQLFAVQLANYSTLSANQIQQRMTGLRPTIETLRRSR